MSADIKMALICVSRLANPDAPSILKADWVFRYSSDTDVLESISDLPTAFRAAWLPRGENAHSRSRPGARKFKARSLNCDVTALTTVLLPRSCSTRPIDVPCSSFEAAIAFKDRPTIAAKTMGKMVGPLAPSQYLKKHES